MNIVLTNKDQSEFYVASVKKVDDLFVARGKRVTKEGRLVVVGQEFPSETEKGANASVKRLVKTKITRKGWLRIELEDLPQPVVKFLEVPPEMQITPEEMILIMRKATSERYVIFIDVTGIEEYFDAGVEYLGYVTDDQAMVKVYDRFGSLRDCFANRIKTMRSTERAEEAEFKELLKSEGEK